MPQQSSAGRSLSFRNGVIGILALACFCVFYFSIFHSPATNELSTKVATLELQLQQLRASYNSAAPRESLVNVKSQLTELQGKISKHEAVLDVSKKLSAENEVDEKQRQQIIESAQREIQILREEIKTLQKAYETLQAQNAADHQSILSETRETESRVKQTEAQPKDSSEAALSNPGHLSLGMDTVLLIICHNRADYLSRTLEGIQRYHPKDSVPIVISQDGNDPQVVDTIDAFKKSFRAVAPSVPVLHLQHQKNIRSRLDGYHYLAEHYKYALDTVFYGSRELSEALSEARRAIILEEDLDISADFFEYFTALAPMLDSDASLLAVSAWNDNGMKGYVRDPSQLYRSDFFPGLGWMLTRTVWGELSVKWPPAYWDDWLREAPQRRGRHVIRPEVCRTYHFGMKGTSNAQYSTFLTDIELNKQFVEFTKKDLSYLHKDEWDASYIAKVKAAPLATVEDVLRRRGADEVRIEYDGLEGFERAARSLGIMDNIKAGVPRTAYRGVVSFWKNDIKVHLAPRNL